MFPEREALKSSWNWHHLDITELMRSFTLICERKNSKEVAPSRRRCLPVLVGR